MEILIIVIVAILVTISVVIARKYPTQETRRKIEVQKLQKHFQTWGFLELKWKCVEIISNYEGPLGSRPPVVILESDTGERILLFGRGISIGETVNLRLRNKEELRDSSFSYADEYLVPA